MQDDIREISSLLDETIQKSETRRERKKQLKKAVRRARLEALKKSLTHDPFNPVQMNAGSEFYNPYMLLEDGSYAPWTTAHWEAMGKTAEGYETVDQFYQMAGVQKAEAANDLKKAQKGWRGVYKALQKNMNGPKNPGLGGKGKVPVGTVHVWSGQRFKKVAEGVWLPEGQGKQKGQPQQTLSDGHVKHIEDNHQKVKKIRDLLKEKRGQEIRDHVEKFAKERGLKTQGSAPEQRVQAKQGEESGASKAPSQEAPKNVTTAGQHLDPDQIRQLEKKIERKGANQGREIRLSKPELDHLLHKGKFALISAGVNPNDPEDVSLDESAVKKRYAQLKDDLVRGGYAFNNAVGAYGDKENSFLVMVHDHDRNQILSLGKKFKQDSVILVESGKQEMHFTTGDNAGRFHEGNGFEYKPDAEDLYTKIDTPEGPVKFALNFNFNAWKSSKSIEGKGKSSGKGFELELDGDKGRADNGLPEFAETAGKDVVMEQVEKFITHFEKDFQHISTKMGNDLKANGAEHFATRLKEKSSLLTKMNGRLSDRSLNTVTDVLGSRAIVKDIANADKLLKHIQKKYEIVEFDNSMEQGRADGYRAIHALYRTPSGKIGELQIKTPRQQAFSGFTHDHIYKGEPEIKNSPEVQNYAVALSNYLYRLDKGEMKDELSARPKEPAILKEKGLEFPWHLVDGMMKSMKQGGGGKYFAVVRDKKKTNLETQEFKNFNEAKKFQQEKYKLGHKGEVVIGSGSNKESFHRAFTEYGPGSRGGVVVGRTKTGKPKYQSQTKKAFNVSVTLAAGEGDNITKSFKGVVAQDSRAALRLVMAGLREKLGPVALSAWIEGD